MSAAGVHVPCHQSRTYAADGPGVPEHHDGQPRCEHALGIAEHLTNHKHCGEMDELAQPWLPVVCITLVAASETQRPY